MKRLLSLLLLLPALAWGQSYPLFKPANGILKGQTTTYVTTAAASSDVITLWTGSCSSTTFLRGDGQCQSPGGAGIGTVTSVGLAFTGSGLTVSNSPVTSAGTLTFSGVLNVATGGIGVGTLTGLAKGNGTSAFSAAASSDVISLWTGTCNSTTFLRADGSCQTVAGTTDASTLTTGTLADARLSSNVALKNGSNVFTGITQSISAAAPNLLLNDTGGGTNQKAGRLIHNSNTLRLEACNDAFSTCSNVISASHSGAGATVDIVNITGTAVNANGNAILTTASSLAAANLTGTIADARQGANVALKNVAGQNFSVVGPNSLTVENTSTGDSFFTVKTNGVTRTYLCSSTIAGNCVTGSAANDTVLRGTQKVRISADDGVSSAAQISNAQIDFNATVVNVNGLPLTPASGDFTFSSSSFSSTVNVTAHYEKIGNVVTLFVPSLNGTSNSISFTFSGLPSIIQPTRQQKFKLALCWDSNTDQDTAYMTFNASGGTGSYTKFGGNFNATTWTNSGTKGCTTHTVTYILN